MTNNHINRETSSKKPFSYKQLFRIVKRASAYKMRNLPNHACCGEIDLHDSAREIRSVANDSSVLNQNFGPESGPEIHPGGKISLALVLVVGKTDSNSG